MSVIWSAKDPDEVADYTIDFAARLGTDVISSAEFSLVTAAGLSIDSSEYGRRFATVRLSGGTDGAKAEVLCEIVTTGGQTLQESATLLIRER